MSPLMTFSLILVDVAAAIYIIKAIFCGLDTIKKVTKSAFEKLVGEILEAKIKAENKLKAEAEAKAVATVEDVAAESDTAVAADTKSAE